MHEHHDASYWTRRHTEQVVLDIGGDVGALVLYTPQALHGLEIEVSPLGEDSRRVHSAVLERAAAGRTMYAAVYPELRAGRYRIWGYALGQNEVDITAGAVAEVDWR